MHPWRWDSDEGRQAARNLIREHMALMMLAHRLSPELRESATTAVRDTESMAPRRLREVALGVEREVRRLRRHLGTKTSQGELIAFLAHAEKGPSGNIAFIPKLWLAAQCRHYARVAPSFDLAPAHAWIGLNPGVMAVRGTWEMRLLDATMYEDMATLYNAAASQREAAEGRGVGGEKQALKARDALCRATVMAAFNFVESYLNGMAFDCLARYGDQLSPREVEVLVEWDDTRGRRRYQRFRDKVLQYPKIALRAAEPPLDETRSPALRYILAQAKDIRDAVAHPSPRVGRLVTAESEAFEEFDKESIVYAVSWETADQVARNAVTLVRELESAVTGSLEAVDWLMDVAEDGRFPDASFS